MMIQWNFKNLKNFYFLTITFVKKVQFNKVKETGRISFPSLFIEELSQFFSQNLTQFCVLSPATETAPL